MKKEQAKKELTKRFKGYTDEDLQVFNGENEETLKFWNREDAIEEAVETSIDEGIDGGDIIECTRCNDEMRIKDYENGDLYSDDGKMPCPDCQGG